MANLFALDGRLLRAEAKRRRQAREERVRGNRAAVAQRRGRTGRTVPRSLAGAQPPGEGSGSAETAVLHLRLVRLVAEKQAEFLERVGQMNTLLTEIQKLAQDGVAIEVVIAESGVGELALDLHALSDELTHLAITRNTIRRVL